MTMRLKNLLCASTFILALGAVPASAAPKRSIGFVVTTWETAMYETKYYEECPEGLALGNDELWWKGLSPQDRDKFTNGGLIEPVDPPRRPMSVLRGPQKEDVCWNPEIVKDPPLRTVKGPFGYGFNLDGTSDGKATAKTCGHEKFTTPDTKTKVDNQMYRLLGCTYGWRKGNYVEGHANRERRDQSQGTILIEVTDIDDMQNDSAVNVKFYATRDVLPKDAAGRILPFASYRISPSPIYGAGAKGRIVEGVLKTDAIDARLPLYGHAYTGDMFIRDLQVELPIEPRADGDVQVGMMAGYYDFESWWDYIRRIESVLVTGQWSCPAVYVAAKQLADGYPDSKTGECTAISTAMRLEVLPAFVIHPAQTSVRSEQAQ